MKESGLNYFYSQLTSLGFSNPLQVFYTFEEGAGNTTQSIKSGNSQYLGTINGDSTDFWNKPGSGFFSGANININNASGLNSNNFTHLFVLEKVDNGDIILFSNQNNNSGYTIGITPTNKLYFQTLNSQGQNIIAASTNNISSKNLLSVSFLTNYVSFGYYNFNSQSFETESFNAQFENPRSDIWSLGKSFTGYLDYYLYFNEYINDVALNILASGFYNIPTGTGFNITTNCYYTVTGYVQVPFVQTGITGYLTTTAGDGSPFGDFFPTTVVNTPLTGIVSSGYINSGISGLSCQNITGALTTLFDTKTGYVSQFGMNKLLIEKFVYSADLVKVSVSNKIFDNNYNFVTFPMYSGFNTTNFYSTGQLNVFINGLAYGNSGISTSSRFLFLSGSDKSDDVYFDLASGDKIDHDSPPYNLISFSGQDLYLDGINLISGFDFITAGNTVILTNNNSGVSGTLSEYPIVLGYITGSFSILYTGNFSRNTSRIFINGLRQQNKIDYIESCSYDMLSGNHFDENINTLIYDGNENYWG